MEEGSAQSYQIGSVYYRYQPGDDQPHYAGRLEQIDEKVWKKLVNSKNVELHVSPRIALQEATKQQIILYF